jgi:hypothetical protein
MSTPPALSPSGGTLVHSIRPLRSLFRFPARTVHSRLKTVHSRLKTVHSRLKTVHSRLKTGGKGKLFTKKGEREISMEQDTSQNGSEQV